MDKLKIGAIERMGDVMFTTAQVEGMTVPALELRLDGPVDEALLNALEEGKLEIYGADGVKQGEYPGYGRVAEMQARNEALEQENADLLYENLTGEVPA